MTQDLLDHRRIFNAGDDLPGADDQPQPLLYRRLSDPRSSQGARGWRPQAADPRLRFPMRRIHVTVECAQQRPDLRKFDDRRVACHHANTVAENGH